MTNNFVNVQVWLGREDGSGVVVPLTKLQGAVLWNSLSDGVTFRKLKFLESRQYYLCDKFKVS